MTIALSIRYQAAGLMVELTYRALPSALSPASESLLFQSPDSVLEALTREGARKSLAEIYPLLLEVHQRLQLGQSEALMDLLKGTDVPSRTAPEVA